MGPKYTELGPKNEELSQKYLRPQFALLWPENDFTYLRDGSKHCPRVVYLFADRTGSLGQQPATLGDSRFFCWKFLSQNTKT
jgi:hypothetical protein